MSYCTKCGQSVQGQNFCGRCGSSISSASVSTGAANGAAYQRITSSELLGFAILAPFMMLAFAGCSLFIPVVGWVLLPFAILGIPTTPFIVYFLYRRAVRGPCPYCGAKCGAQYRAFTCRACRKRVLVSESAFTKVLE